MRTDDLIDMLAEGPLQVAGRPVTRRLGVALGVGAPVVFAIMWITLGVRADLGAAMAEPAMWAKLAFVLAAAAAALLATIRLARPGIKLGAALVLPAVPVALVWLWGAAELTAAQPDQRMDALLGRTWTFCPWLIAALSLPALALSLWALRGLAPTRPRLAGAAAGLLSGALAATIYALHCPEMTAPFIATWYVLGMLAPAVLGALLGPRVLRW